LVPRGSSGQDVSDVSVVPVVGDFRSGGAQSQQLVVSDFPRARSASQRMTPSMINGLMQNVWDEDPISIMEKLLKESTKPSPLREPPFRSAVFLNLVTDPKENPWWILFGYDTDRNCWKGSPGEYGLDAIDGILPLVEMKGRTT
jgi:hypothetical protein